MNNELQIPFIQFLNQVFLSLDIGLKLYVVGRIVVAVKRPCSTAALKVLQAETMIPYRKPIASPHPSIHRTGFSSFAYKTPTRPTLAAFSTQGM